ncbi:MAG: hypothetical protein ACRYF3_16895 [Janthinobacterium lividum]
MNDPAAAVGMSGSPAVIEAAADDLTRSGDALDATGRNVRTHADQATGEWFGAAGDAARAVLDGSASYVTGYADLTSAAAPILQEYAQALRAAQHADAEGRTRTAAATVAVAVASAKQAQRSAPQAATLAAPGGAGVDPQLAQALTRAQGELDEAQALVSDAWAALAQADSTATERITALTTRLHDLAHAISTGAAAPVGSAPPSPTLKPISEQETVAPDGSGLVGTVKRWWEDAGDFVSSVGGYYREHPEAESDLILSAGTTALGLVIATAGSGTEVGEWPSMPPASVHCWGCPSTSLERG